MVGITMHKVLAFTVVALTGVNALAISTPCPEENGKVTYAGNTPTKSSSAPAAYATVSSSTSTPCSEENGKVTYAAYPPVKSTSTKLSTSTPCTEENGKVTYGGNSPAKSTSAPAIYSAISSPVAAQSGLSSAQASYSVISSIKVSPSAVSASASASSSASLSAQVTSSTVSKSAVSSSAVSSSATSKYVASSSAVSSSSVSSSAISSSAMSSASSSASKSMSSSMVVSSSAVSSSALPSSTVKSSSSVVSSSAVSSSAVTSSAVSSSAIPSSSMVPSSSAPAKPSCTPFVGLKNPSFEDGLAPWNKNNGATLVGDVVEATTPAGTHVYQGSLTAAGSATWQIIQGSVMIQSGTTISCSALFKSLAPGKVTYTMLIDGKPCGTPTVPTTGDFAQPAGSIKVTGDIHTILIRVLGTTVPAGPVFQLDNIQLTSTAGPGLCGGQ